MKLDYLTTCNISKSTHLELTTQKPGFCMSNDNQTALSQFTRATLIVRKLSSAADQIPWLFCSGKMRRWTGNWLGRAVCGIYCFIALLYFTDAPFTDRYPHQQARTEVIHSNSRLLVTFAKLRKTTIGFVVSFRPSVHISIRIQQLSSHRTEFH